MLVLSRKKKEALIIELEDGRLIRILINDIQGDKVRIATDCAKSIRIWRDEIYHDARQQDATPHQATAASA